jgi:hypothetical protein
MFFFVVFIYWYAIIYNVDMVSFNFSVVKVLSSVAEPHHFYAARLRLLHYCIKTKFKKGTKA